ncbi:transcription factor Opi1 [Ceratobasidium sp. AG-Ba]|nr:transcription factor Opi1 [Ceratobasidium sp. AG-Ba]QRW03052.1 transcription factor Opi1 [Ceratobasidium sp. AG-Ba]
MSTTETATMATRRPVALTTAIIDEHDADVLMAVQALGDMRSQGVPGTSATPLYTDSAPSLSGATPAPSQSADSANASEQSISRPLLDDDVASGDFVSRVSTLPLVTSVLSAYSQTKASSRVVKMVESSVKTISRPVIDRLPTAQLDEFACRQLDKFEQRYGARTDSPRDDSPRTPTPRSQPTQEPDSGPARGRSLERRISTSATSATSLRSPTSSATRDDGVPSLDDAGSGIASVPAADSDRQVANRSRWQAMLLEAGGIGAALSDESMKRLKYCLQWLQYATNRIDSQIAVLREFLDSLSPGAGAGNPLLPLHLDQDAPVSPATLARLSAVKRDVVATIRQAVDIVSRYAGGALPEPARGTVRSVLLRLPERWASAGREVTNDGPGSGHPAHRRTGSSSSARAPYPPRSTTPADGTHAARPGPRPHPTAGTAAQAAQRVMTLATESLDMMRGVTGVVKDSLDRAEVWVDRLRVVGIQRGEQGADIPDSSSSPSHQNGGIPGTPALTSGSGSPRSLSMLTPLSPMSFPHSFRDALAHPRTNTHSVFSSYPSSAAVSTAGSDTETDGNEDVKPALGHVRKKRRKGGGREAKRHKDMDVDEDVDTKLPSIKIDSEN